MLSKTTSISKGIILMLLTALAVYTYGLKYSDVACALHLLAFFGGRVRVSKPRSPDWRIIIKVG